MTQISRRSILAGTGALLGAALAHPAITFAQDAPKVLRVALTPGTYSLVIAQDRGYFARHGLTLEFVSLATGTETIAAVRGGSAELAYADTFAGVNAIANGFDITLVQGANHTSQAMSYLVKQDSPITSPADMKGRSLGIGAVPFFRVFAHKFLDANGVAPQDVNITLIKQSTALPETLENGAVDAIQVNGLTPYYLNDGKGEGFDFRLVGDPSTRDYQDPAAVQAGFWSTAEWARDNADLGHRFAAAYREFAAWFNALALDERITLALEFDKQDYRAIAGDDAEALQNLAFLNAARYVEGPVDLAATQAWIDAGAAIAPQQIPQNVQIAGHILPEAG